jgi:hypothetical protein
VDESLSTKGKCGKTEAVQQVTSFSACGAHEFRTSSFVIGRNDVEASDECSINFGDVFTTCCQSVETVRPPRCSQVAPRPRRLRVGAVEAEDAPQAPAGEVVSIARPHMKQFAAPRASDAGQVDEQCCQEAACHRQASYSPQHLLRWEDQGWPELGDARNSQSAHEDRAEAPVGEKALSSEPLELYLDGSH